MATVSKLMVPFACTVKGMVCNDEPRFCRHTQQFPTSGSAHELCVWEKGKRHIQFRPCWHGWAKPRRATWAGKKCRLTSFTVPNYDLHEAWCKKQRIGLRRPMMPKGRVWRFCLWWCIQVDFITTVHTGSSTRVSETKLSMFSCKQYYPRGQLLWKKVANVADRCPGGNLVIPPLSLPRLNLLPW